MAEYTDEGVTAAVDALGNDGHEVAEALRAKGIRGIPHDCFNCPGALYLKGLYPDCDVHVDRSYIRLDRTVRTVDENGYEHAETEVVVVETTGPLVEFIAAFDADQHPHLKRRKP